MSERCITLIRMSIVDALQPPTVDRIGALGSGSLQLGCPLPELHPPSGNGSIGVGGGRARHHTIMNAFRGSLTCPHSPGKGLSLVEKCVKKMVLWPWWVTVRGNTMSLPLSAGAKWLRGLVIAGTAS
jgi:hypothetical protein